MIKRLKDAVKRLNQAADRLEESNARRVDLMDRPELQATILGIYQAELASQRARLLVGIKCQQCRFVNRDVLFPGTDQGLAEAIGHLVADHQFPLRLAISSVQESTWTWDGWDGTAPRPWYWQHLPEEIRNGAAA